MITERGEVQAEDTPNPTVRTYSISEAAMFLGRSTQWLRWRSEQLSEEFPEDFQVPRGENNYRKYDLDTIQKLADLLFKAKRITAEEHKGICSRVKAFRQ